MLSGLCIYIFIRWSDIRQGFKLQTCWPCPYVKGGGGVERGGGGTMGQGPPVSVCTLGEKVVSIISSKWSDNTWMVSSQTLQDERCLFILTSFLETHPYPPTPLIWSKLHVHTVPIRQPYLVFKIWLCVSVYWLGHFLIFDTACETLSWYELCSRFLCSYKGYPHFILHLF